jgi:hypothetical protein
VAAYVAYSVQSVEYSLRASEVTKQLNICAALLYIHRSFFAQALLDHPSNPLRSRYAPSFLAAYRCASGVIKSAVNQFDRFPDLSMRWWMVWTHLFSAAVSYLQSLSQMAIN